MVDQVELVERVAKAIAADQSKRRYGIDRGADEAWNACTDWGRERLLDDARAAIEAIATFPHPNNTGEV